MLLSLMFFAKIMFHNDNNQRTNMQAEKVFAKFHKTS